MSGLAHCVGVPLKIDGNTLAGEFGHYAKVLIDVDLASHLPYLIFLNRKEGNVTVGNICKIVGHATSACRRLEIIRRS